MGGTIGQNENFGFTQIILSHDQKNIDLTRVAQKTVGYLPKGFLHVNYLVNNLVTYQGGKCREVNYLL